MLITACSTPSSSAICIFGLPLFSIRVFRFDATSSLKVISKQYEQGYLIDKVVARLYNLSMLQGKVESFFTDAGCMSFSRGCFYIKKCIEEILTEGIIVEMIFLKGLYERIISKNKMTVTVSAVEKSVERFISEEWQKFSCLFSKNHA